MEIVAIDLETTVKCPVGNNKANPMWLGNYVVAAGHSFVGDGTVRIMYNSEQRRKWTPHIISKDEEHLLVGHNVKFDLLYLYRDTPWRPLPHIWDTQLAEYILTGQEEKYVSLDSLISKYEVASSKSEFKVAGKTLKEYWSTGGQTEDIDPVLLCNYLENDVTATRIIFQEQWRIAGERGQIPLILSQMDALRATTAMNLHGMAVDWEYVHKGRDVYRSGAASALEGINKLVPTLDPHSPKQLSLYFFGGKETVMEKILVGKYKNGNDKYKLTPVEKVHEGHLVPNTTINKNGYYSVDESVLEFHIKYDKKADPTALQVCKFVLTLRQCSKIAETYYQGLVDLRFATERIYPQLNHVATATGRLSCTAPNLQNQTTLGDVKRAYASRWGENGSMLELDYSQLEVVWLAYISGDEQLIKDINNDVDIHSVLFEGMYHRSPTKDERKAFKPRTFQLVYGAGAGAIATQADIPIEEAKKFITVFYTRYKGVADYHKKLMKEATDAATVFYDGSTAHPRYEFTKKMPWGRHYRFTSYPNDWTTKETFSPTELKNYPMQGSATGDHVPLIVGILQRELEKTEAWFNQKACLVMTVHDSILLDVHDSVVYSVANLAKKVMEDAPRYLKEKFDIDFPCKLKVGVEYGRTWQDMTELNTEEYV